MDTLLEWLALTTSAMHSLAAWLQPATSALDLAALIALAAALGSTSGSPLKLKIAAEVSTVALGLFSTIVDKTIAIPEVPSWILPEPLPPSTALITCWRRLFLTVTEYTTLMATSYQRSTGLCLD